MSRRWLISRRTTLKGLGIAMALPLLDVMGWAESPKAGGARIPTRLGFIYLPNGAEPQFYFPKGDKLDAKGELPSTFEGLRHVLGDCLVLGGLQHDRVGDTKGPSHGLEMCSWLTGVAPKGPNVIENATSADQLAAQRLGLYTALPSLEIGRQAMENGLFEDMFSRTYYGAVSWRSPSQPNPPETSLRAVLARMFSSRKGGPPKRGGAPAVDRREFLVAGGPAAEEPAADGPSLDRSMLDLVQESTQDFAKLLGADDQRRLDEYQENIRGLEKRISAIERQQAELAAASRKEPARKSTSSPLIEVQMKDPTTFTEWFDLAGDLTILAYQADVTRVISTVLGRALADISLPEIGVTDGHHALSHADNKAAPDYAAKLEKLRKVDQHFFAQFGKLVEKMRAIKEGDGTLLDHSLITFGSGMGEGRWHRRANVPIILAGRGNGTVRTGRYVPKCNGNLCDYWMAVLARAGVTLEQPLGNGTKLLPDLA